MIAYVDASVPLRVILGQPARLASWGDWDEAFSSELLGLEVRRTLDRLRIQGALDADQLADLLRMTAVVEEGLGMVALTRTVLSRAALPMAVPVRTLDAIHLATALMIQERGAGAVTFATHDAQQAAAARSLGFAVVGI